MPEGTVRAGGGRSDRVLVQTASGLLEDSEQAATFGSGVLGHRRAIKTDGCFCQGQNLLFV